MQKYSYSFFTIFLTVLLAFTSGCSKKNETPNKADKKSFFSKVRKKDKQTKNEQNIDGVNAFNLDDDTMKSFALDDSLAQHTSTQPSSSQKVDNKLLAWENISEEESKDQFKKLFFEFDKYVLLPSQEKDLNYDINQAKKMIKKGKTIVIEGHACHSDGSAIYNLALSEKRARYVATKFSDAGIDPKIIKIAPRGQEMPIRKGGNREEQAVNRRVEIFAIDAN